MKNKDRNPIVEPFDGICREFIHQQQGSNNDAKNPHKIVSSFLIIRTLTCSKRCDNWPSTPSGSNSTTKMRDPETWYLAFRDNNLSKLFPKLVENVEQEGGKDKQRFYTLRPDPMRKDVAVLQGQEFKPGDAAKLPFNQPSGSQAAALGPVIKRSAPSGKKEAGPERQNPENDPRPI